jgi:hypothetical protein
VRPITSRFTMLRSPKKIRDEKKEDSDEDVEVILEAATSTFDSPAARAKSPKRIGRSVSFQGVMENIVELDDKPDSDKTHEELLNKNQRLLERLEKAEIDVSGEKVIRKKKEKSLMKLARELKNRNQQKDEAVERVGEVSVIFWLPLT